MRLISVDVYVGDIVLQQLAQLRQSISCHISVSICEASLSKPREGFFSIRRKYFKNSFLRKLIFFLNEYRLTGCMYIDMTDCILHLR